MHVQIVSNPAPDTREMTGPAEPLVSGSPIELKSHHPLGGPALDKEFLPRV